MRSNQPEPLASANSISTPPKFTKVRTIQTYLRRFAYRNTTNSPFLSGDSFAQLADYAAFGLTGREPFDAKAAKRAATFFVQSEKLEEFEKIGLNLGLTANVIITGNSDRNFEQPRPNPLSCNLWLCQNNAMPSRSGLASLPIGLENKRLGRLGLEKWYVNTDPKDRAWRLLVPPMRPTNPIRARVLQEVSSLGKTFQLCTQYLHAADYFELLKKYRFVLCLEGNGFDTHRIWESLYLGVFPVVLSTNWSRNLTDLALPILVVDEIREITPKLLRRFWHSYADFDAKVTPQLWMPFWEQLIKGSPHFNRNLT